MNPTKLTRRLARPARDFLAGLMLFAAVALSGVIDRPPAGTSWITSSAHAQLYEAEVTAAAPELSHSLGLQPFLVQLPAPVIHSSGMQQTMALLSLALAFAAMFALNLWFTRHLRRVHASHRRKR